MDKPIFTVLLGFLGVSIGIADIHLALKFMALAVPTAYTLWRWHKDWKKG